MNKHRSKRECVVIMFLHCLLQTVFTTPVNSVPCYGGLTRMTSNERAMQMEQVGQTLEVLTTDQGYLMFFDEDLSH